MAVRESVIGDVMEARDKGQGLFTVREVRRGEVVSFYSGYVIKNEQVLNKLSLVRHGIDKEVYFMK